MFDKMAYNSFIFSRYFNEVLNKSSILSYMSLNRAIQNDAYLKNLRKEKYLLGTKDSI